MMGISRKADYAIRCVLLLSGSKQELYPLEKISSRLDLPKPFLAKVLQILSKAKIVASSRGVNGGFCLARNPACISLFDVIEAIDGAIFFNTCAIASDACKQSNSCSVHPIWFELRNIVTDKLSSITFDALIACKE
jgi:Rrf2 family transcriptional regulator, iron-sulfur cluster assembly transcription factor